MNFYAFSAIFIASTTFILGIIVYVKNRKGAVNKAFSYFAFCVFFWSAAYYFWQTASNATSALFYCRLLMAGAIFIPVTYLHFVLVLIKKADKKRNFLIVSYCLFFIFLLTDLTPLFVNRVEPLLNFSFWPRPGVAFHLFLSSWFAYVCYTTYLLYTAYKSSIGLIRDQVKYVLWGFIIGFIAGSSNYLLWYKIPIPPFLNIFGSVYVAGMAYSIIRYRFMDIRIVARKAFVFIGQAALTYLTFYLVAWIYLENFGSIFNNTSYLVGALIAPIFVGIFYWFNHISQKFANKYLFAGLYNYQKTISDLTNKLTTIINLDQIIDLVVDTIRDTMRLERSGVLLREERQGAINYKIERVAGFNEENGISLVKDSFLTNYLAKIQKPLVREELGFLSDIDKDAQEKEKFINLKEQMTKIEASLCLPLISNNILIGIIVLGGKVSGDAYTKEDLELLGVLANQAAIAIENARLYHEVNDLNQNLQAKVEEQTRDIVKKAEHLQKLLKMRSEFLDIASHQLRTPVSVIKGTLSMMREGDFEKISEAEQYKFVDNMYFKSLKLEGIINDILIASEMDTAEFAINIFEEVDLDALLEKIVNDHQLDAQGKDLRLIYKKLFNQKFNIKGNPKFLEQVFNNLIDNAIKYTSKGFVTVSLSKEDNDALVEIKDTGIGIPQEDQAKLFKKFVRAKNARNTYTDGSGLGLYIVKEIIDHHPGAKIWLISKENLGTAFYLQFPLLA